MRNEISAEERVEWRQLLHFDGKAVAALAGCALFLIGFLGILPSWLRAQEKADFGTAARQTAPGTVATVQISPVSQGGGGLFNAVTVAFAGREIYYALPPSSRWNPKRGDRVDVTYRVGRKSGKVRIESVTPPVIITRAGG